MRLQVGKGLEQYLQQLGNLEMTAPKTIGQAIYQGAKIVADAIERNIEALPVDDSQHSEKVKGIRSIQKEGLKGRPNGKGGGFGISKAETINGYRHVKLGFHGYNKLKSAKYPQGQPNAMIARTFEAGNSFTKKQPFVGPAIRSSRLQAESEMAKIIDDDLHRIFN